MQYVHFRTATQLPSFIGLVLISFLIRAYILVNSYSSSIIITN